MSLSRWKIIDHILRDPFSCNGNVFFPQALWSDHRIKKKNDLFSIHVFEERFLSYLVYVGSWGLSCLETIGLRLWVGRGRVERDGLYVNSVLLTKRKETSR